MLGGGASMRGGGINRALHREQREHAKESEKEALLKQKNASRDSPGGAETASDGKNKRSAAPIHGVASALRRRSSVPVPPASLMKRRSTQAAEPAAGTDELDKLPTASVRVSPQS